MAEPRSQDRTERATPRRREEARRRGQVARSTEVNSAAILALGGTAVLASLAMMGRGVGAVGIQFFEGLDQYRLEESVDAVDVLHLAFRSGAAAVGPVLLVLLGVGFLAASVQVGWRLSPEALRWRWNRLDPIAGVQRMFGKRAAFEISKQIFKLAIISGVAVWTVQDVLPRIVTLVALDTASGWHHAWLITRTLLWRLALVVIVLAVVDFVWQRRRLENELRMTRAEVRQEQKDLEGDPHVKARRRQRARSVASRRPAESIARASVLLVGTGGTAVAVRYDPAEAAPRILASAQGEAGRHLESLARAAGVFCADEPALASSLAVPGLAGGFVPDPFFEAVARVLAEVYRETGESPFAGEAPA